MSWLNNPIFLAFDGEPIAGRIPTQVVIAGANQQLTAEQIGGVRHVYKRFCDNRALSIAPYAVHQLMLPDGTAVRMVSNQGRDTVTVWPTGGGATQTGVYMESGLQDLRHALAGFEETYRPAKVLFSPRVASLSAPAGRLPNTFGRKIKSGDESWSSAGKTGDLSDTVTVYLGSSGEPTTFTDDDEVYSQEPDKIRTHKLMRMLIPPSVFTGKLRLFVQALYGSKRRDYEVGSTSNGGTSNQIALDTGKTRTDVNGVIHKIYTHLLHQYPTTGLAKFTFSRPGTTALSTKYILITIHSNRVAWRAMNGLLVTPVAGYPDESEAVTLATLVPGDVEHEASGGPLPAGGPLAYGWHFNKSGSAASICMKEGKSISGKRLYDMADSTVQGLTFKQYTMSFTFTPGETSADDALSYSVSMIASGDHIPYVQSNIFTPLNDGSGVGLTLPGDPTPWNCYASLGPAPIYCFYSDAELRTVFATNSGITYTEATDNTLSSSDGAAIQASATIVSSGNWDYKQVPEKFEIGSCGFTLDGNSFTGTHLKSGYQETEDRYVFSAGYTRESIDWVATEAANAAGISGYVTYTYSYFSTSGTTHAVRATSYGSKSSKAVMVIPYGHASAVMMGIQHASSTDVFWERHYTLGNNIICYDSRQTLYWAGWYCSWYEILYTPAEDQQYTVSSSMKLITDKTSIALGSYSRTSAEPGMGGATDRPYQWAFEATAFGSPVFEYPITVKASEFGMLFHQYTLPGGGTSYSGGWTDGAFWAVPVGWA